MREDYSDNGDAWNYFTHDQARSRAYRWGEDGLAGISDDKQRLCFALALWNGKDPILKERLFGLTNSEGNHGEDVKEYYFYLDSTPTHSYMKYLYKYPQAAYPYADWSQTNRRRSRDEMEYELLDTGVFDDDRYFDVFVEYAKASPEDILIRITAANRGPERGRAAPAADAVVPQQLVVDCRSNRAPRSRRSSRSTAPRRHDRGRRARIRCSGRRLSLSARATCRCSSPRTRPTTQRLFHGHQNADAATSRTASTTTSSTAGRTRSTRPTRHQGRGALPRSRVGAGEDACDPPAALRAASADQKGSPLAEFDEIFDARLREADEFYQSVTPPSVSQDAANVMRQALAGMLWSKQYYYFDADRWLDEHHVPPPASRHIASARNRSGSTW